MFVNKILFSLYINNLYKICVCEIYSMCRSGAAERKITKNQEIGEAER